MLTGELSAEMVKERVKKHPPPENCKFLAVTMMNEEIWDLLPRKSRTVDLAFQRVQEPLLQGILALTKLAGKLVKDINDGKTLDTWHVLDYVMDSVAMLGNTNWKLNMKQRELIKPELNPPYTRLCKEDITLSTKLFGDDLAKHLKDMSEAKKAGQQMQKPYPNSSNRGAVHSQKRNFSRFKPYHYDRTRGSGNKSTNRQPFLGQGCLSLHSGKSTQPASTTKISTIQL